MADRFIQSHVQKLPIFQRLPPDQFDRVVDQFEVQRYEAGEFIFRQGQRIPGMILVISGRGILVQPGASGNEEIVGTVSVNEYLNESSLFIETTANISLRVVETTIVLFLARTKLLRLLGEYPEIKNGLVMQGSRLPALPGMKFSGQRDNEQVVTVLYRHRWAFISRSWIALVPTALLLFLAGVFSQSAPLATAMIGLGVVIGGMMLVYFYMEWHNDSVVITDQRVIHIERSILTFKVKRSEIPLGNILEIKADFPPRDPLARILNYGTVQVKTSGEQGNVKFDMIPSPQTIQNVIFTDQARFRENQAVQTRNAMRGQVDDRVLQRHNDQSGGKGGDKAASKSGSGGFSPLVMKFTNDKGETVYRKHYLIWVGHIAVPLGVIFIGIVIFILDLFGQLMPNGLGLLSYLLGFGVILLGAAWFYLADWDWRNDLYIVGDQTVTLIRKRPLFLQNENDQFLLAQVDNISFDISGLFHTLFKLGNVQLKLVGSGDKAAKVFRSVYDPEQVQAEITKRRQRAKQSQQDAENKRRQSEILDYISVYHERIAGEEIAPPPAEPPQPTRPQAPVTDRSRPPGVPRIRRDDPPR